MSQTVENAVSCNVKESFKKFSDPNPEAESIQNLTSSSSSKDTSLVKFVSSSKTGGSLQAFLQKYL